MAPPAAVISAPADDGVVVIAGKRYLTQERLAQIVDRSPRTLLRWDEQRIGPPRIKVAAKVLYDEAKLPEWLARFETEPVRERRRVRRPSSTTPGDNA
jgi:hypothetical protein